MATLTVYPDANPETTTVDGRAVRLGVNESFAAIIAGAGNFSEDNAASTYIYLETTTTLNQFGGLHRTILLFDTSTLPAGAVISAATLSVWGIAKSNGLGAADLVAVGSNPASNTALVNADYGTLGATSFGSVTYAAFDATDTVYTDITLNASGIAAINAGGITKLGLVLNWDQAASFGGVWASGAASYFQIDAAENASGTAKAPKLTITYDTPGHCIVSLLGTTL